MGAVVTKAMSEGWTRRGRRFLVVGTLSSASWLGLAGPAEATSLPRGFREQVAVSAVPGASAIAWDPSGRLWIAGKGGQVWVVRGSSTKKLAALPVSTDGERGIAGIAIDPDYATNGEVWIYYTAAAPVPHNRVSRFRDAGTRLVDETVVVESPPVKSAVHNGGGLRFAPDKTLFVSIGDDDQRSLTPQDPHDLRGKLLHLNRDGSPAAGNPHADGRDGHPLVWALGFRNPFRFSVQPGSGALFIGDVGGDAWEELDLGIAGGNFGWDRAEGPEPPGLAGYVYPVYAYHHDSPQGNAIIAGDFVPRGNFPSDYEGNYFFADYAASRLYRMVLDSSNRPTSTQIWATELGLPVHVEFGPDGALYYVDFGAGQVRRIVYVGGEQIQPVAVTTVTPDNGPSPLTVEFDASGSYDPEGGALGWAWDFGDGSGSREPKTSHTYPTGVFAAGLTVSAGSGAVSTLGPIPIVSGNRRPTAQIQAPADQAPYAPNQTVSFAGAATDPEDGRLSCDRFEWRVVLHHIPPGGGSGHTHPYLGPIDGVCSGDFAAASHEDDNVYYEIFLTVRDSGSPVGPAGLLSATQSVVIRPSRPALADRQSASQRP